MTPSISLSINQLGDRLGMRSGRARAAGLALFALSLIASLAALSLFPADEQTGSVWWLYLASIPLLIAGCYVLFPASVRMLRLSISTAVIALAILGVATVLRFYRLGDIPFGTWWDEADNGISAQQIINDTDFRPIYIESTHLPTHFIYFIALAFQLLGSGTVAIRAVTAAFGLATVIAAYFVGREAHGHRFGLILAFLFAVARWNVNFSRLGLHGIGTPFFILLTMMFLLRSKRTGQIHDLAWAGLTFGFGLCFYAAFRLFGLVVIGFMIYWVITRWRTARHRGEHPASIAVHVAAFGLAAGLAVAPVAQFAWLNPEMFWSRTNEISLFNRRDETNLGRAIISNTAKHVLMFNYKGDPNGRHNLPGEPMLDPITGVLFVFGIALALSRPRDLAQILFLASFVVGLSGGIFSVDFEAPQALRAIGSMPAVLYFAALAAETLWRGIDRIVLTVTVRRIVNLALALTVGGYIFYSNASTYFVRQANNDSVWEAYNAVETLIARRMLELGPDKTTFHVSMYRYNHLVIQFLAPGVNDSRVIVPPDVLPIREPGDKPVAMFVDRELDWIVDEARRYYPDADYIIDTTPNGNPALYTIIISPEDVQSVQGLTARYWRGDSTDGDPAFTRTEKTLDTVWPNTAPLAAPFVAEWSGVLYAHDYGQYEIVFKSPSSASLWLDEAPVLNGSGEQRVALSLAQGNHAFRAQAASGDGPIQLQWRPVKADTETSLETVPAMALYLSPPASNHGLLGAFYNGPDWQAPAQFSKVDPFINMYFHIIPLTRPYTVEWAGQIEILADGEYTFGITVTGTAQLFVDDQRVVEASNDTGYTEGKINLNTGRHKLRLMFLDNLGGSQLRFYWTPPGGEKQIVPSDVLLPYP